MLNKENFCLIIDAMKEDYDRGNAIYNDLKKYDIYVDIEKSPLTTMLDKLINANFNEHQAQIIFDYTYPIFDREEISSAELYDDIIRLGDEK